MNSVADIRGSLSFIVDNPDDLTKSIDCIVSESVDEFAPISQHNTEKKQ